MNKWQKLLAMLKGIAENPYAGDDNDLAAVKKYVADNGIELVSETDESAIDLDAMHKSAQAKTKLRFDDTPAPKANAPAAPKSRGAFVEGDGPAIHVKGGGNVGILKKNYEARAKSQGIGIEKGQTCFADADSAEVVGAALRYGFASRHHVTANYSQRAADEEILTKSGSEYNPTTGGVLVPPEYQATLIYLKELYGVTRKVCNVVPMARDTKMQPRITAINAMAPIGELQSITAGGDNTDLVSLNVKKWGRLAQFSNELLDDSAISVTDIFARTAVEAQTKAEDQTYFLGDGTATYNQDVGLANALPSSAYVSASGNAWSAITEGDINKLIGTVENVDITRCAFITSRQYYAQVMQPMYTSSGRGKQEEFRTMFGLRDGQGAEWKGWPVIFSQVLPTVSASASKGLYFGDYMAASMLGDRRDLTIATSEHVYFASDAFAVRAISRFTVNIHGDGRGSTYGPIACLKTT